MKFAATYFQGQASAQHIKKALRQPLLYHESSGDQLASLAVWITILRFMGDLPEPKFGGDPVSDKVPVMTKVFSSLTKQYSRNDVESASQAAEFEATNMKVKKSASISKKNTRHASPRADLKSIRRSMLRPSRSRRRLSAKSCGRSIRIEPGVPIIGTSWLMSTMNR